VVKEQETVYTELPRRKLKWLSVPLSEIIATGCRLEATLYNAQNKRAVNAVKNCKYGFVPLRNLVSKAYYPGRFKRIYTKSPHGIPFFLPSQITDIHPKADKYISRLTKCDIGELRLKRGDVLLTRSGTIGELTLVSKTLENTVFSDDVIRVTAHDNLSGYIYAFLHSSIGNTLLQTNNYGAVIKHIEPEHLSGIPVPNPPDNIKAKINNLIIRSFELRDESNESIDEAETMLIKELKLPPIDGFTTERFDNGANVNAYSVKLSELAMRLDGSYHLPIVKAITKHLRTHASEVTTVGDRRVNKAIILPGRFKRVYVEEGCGQVFFSGKNIMELDPTDKRYLSFSRHDKRIKEFLTIHHNMILVTCSGTVGKITIVPKHWDNWAMTHDIIRLVPKNGIEGYAYIWLRSEYANRLIEAMAYGSVVSHIEISHIEKIPFPFLKNTAAQNEINRLALHANELRYQAYLLEREAMGVLENEVLKLSLETPKERQCRS
jgi:type I restriction enzyme, S subunit